VDLEAFPLTDDASGGLVNDCDTVVDAYPGQDGCLTVVSFRPAAKLALISGECRKLL
jgi:hypothetical protein